MIAGTSNQNRGTESTTKLGKRGPKGRRQKPGQSDQSPTSTDVVTKRAPRGVCEHLKDTSTLAQLCSNNILWPGRRRAVMFRTDGPTENQGSAVLLSKNRPQRVSWAMIKARAKKGGARARVRKSEKRKLLVRCQGPSSKMRDERGRQMVKGQMKGVTAKKKNGKNTDHRDW